MSTPTTQDIIDTFTKAADGTLLTLAQACDSLIEQGASEADANEIAKAVQQQATFAVLQATDEKFPEGIPSGYNHALTQNADAPLGIEFNRGISKRAVEITQEKLVQKFAIADAAQAAIAKAIEPEQKQKPDADFGLTPAMT